MNGSTPDPTDYLRVDAFLRDMPGAVALDAAFRLGLIDAVQASAGLSESALMRRLGIEPQGGELLLSMLRGNQVLTRTDEPLALTGEFAEALNYRELLQAKLDFARLVAPDFLTLLPLLLARPDRFFEQAGVFRLFDYGRCLDINDDNLKATAGWVRFTTALTQHEALACLQMHDFSSYRRHLDVGGNSGEFALQLCRRHANLSSVVHDLPVVCEIGRQHLARQPEAARITFSAVQPDSTVLPQGFDLVSFKSMLHDWPDPQTESFLRRAHEALLPGGRVLIFERAPYRPQGQAVPYSLLPVLAFFRSYRPEAFYRQLLQRVGFEHIECQSIELDMSFHLITARRPAAPGTDPSGVHRVSA